MLTTFNELDMSAVMEIRKTYQQSFQQKHGVKLGLMSFFTRAAALALLEFPKINSGIDGEDIVTPSYVDIGIAVQTDKGLMVPSSETQNPCLFLKSRKKLPSWHKRPVITVSPLKK